MRNITIVIGVSIFCTIAPISAKAKTDRQCQSVSRDVATITAIQQSEPDGLSLGMPS